MSLKVVLNEVAQSNLTLRTARQELGVLEGRVTQAKAIPNPEVEGGVNTIPFRSEPDDENSKELGISQTFEIWGKRRLRTKSAASDLESARADYRALEKDIFRQTKETYWALSLADDRVNVAQENLTFQQRFLARVQDHFQSGETKLSDVARAKLEAAKASNDLLVAHKNRQKAQSDLNRLMGRDIRLNIPVVAHLEEKILELNEDNLIQEALGHRPERQSVAALKDGAHAEISLARRLLWAPDLKTGLVYQKGELAGGRNSWGWNLGLALPLWYQYGGERKSASSRLEALDARARDIDQSITLEVHQAFLDIGLSAEQVRLWRQAVDQATEAARLAEQQYMEGNADLLVFISSRRDLISTTLDYLEALRSYQVNLAALERAIGNGLIGGEQ